VAGQEYEKLLACAGYRVRIQLTPLTGQIMKLHRNFTPVVSGAVISGDPKSFKDGTIRAQGPHCVVADGQAGRCGA